VDEGPTLPKPGEVLAGKYELVRLIGKGGMGVVYEAGHLRLKQRFAIKMLRPNLLDHYDCVTRFDREARAAARMTCPNVARIFDVDRTSNGIPYMVIEFLEGHDLSQELAGRKTLPPAEAVDVVLQACSAMAEAHALGVVHRDLKPANLFLCGNGLVKVLDFGISKVFEEEVPQTTTPSLALGTPHYMSPEQILASKDVDPRSDVWSLGVILYKAICGRFPFSGDSSTALVVAIATHAPAPFEASVEVPAGLATATMKALAKERADRWSTVDEFALAIQPFGSGRVAFSGSAGVSSTPQVQLARAEDYAATIVDRPSGRTVHSDWAPTVGNWTQSAPAAKKRPWRGVTLFALGAALMALGTFAFLVLREPGTPSRFLSVGASSGSSGPSASSSSVGPAASSPPLGVSAASSSNPSASAAALNVPAFASSSRAPDRPARPVRRAPPPAPGPAAVPAPAAPSPPKDPLHL
jgi:serine/threonine-protein kinase